ncbi:uncharacterized protein LOC127850853 isoform X1 [Dreissena polymorpha]|uniref:uncharacterized protein LOC127850853 isoform X1 n=1 Tax=Dreissena polymorpha TaxID=45954 RepID=UPI0022656254|nr:uncharacterized protein LOC127850853 isoform X1 [Dreissena polymorpha]
MITKCNGTYKCYEFALTPWGAFLPMYSPSHHKIYINEQCAICNGITDGKHWHPYIVCQGASPSEIDAIVSAIALRTIIPICYVHFTYPYDDAHTMYKLQCYKTRENSCPDDLELNPRRMEVTERLGVDYDTIVDLCHSSIESVYTQRLFNGQESHLTYFKNIFCFLCSGAPLPNNECTSDLRDTLSSLGQSTFAMLLASTPGVINATITPIRACKVNDDRTTDLSNCRVMHCPVGQIRDATGLCLYPSKQWKSGRVGIFVKVLIPEPIKLSPNTTLSDVHAYFKDIDFNSESPLPWVILNSYFNLIVDADFAMINFFALEMAMKVGTFDPSDFLNAMKEFLNTKWFVHFRNVSESCSQELVPQQLFNLLHFFPQYTNDTRVFMDEIYNLIRIENGVFIYVRYSFFISKTFFCNMLEFSDDEVLLLHNGLIVYLIEFDKYFGDMEFLMSVDAGGKTTVKVCMERLPFKRVMNDANNQINKTLNILVLVCSSVIVNMALYL